MDLTVAIPVMDADPALFRTVVRAAASQAPVLVVDMSAAPKLRGVVEETRGEYVHWPKSSGVSASRNECLRRITTRYALLLDSDAVPRPGWAAAMRRGLDEPRVAIVGARVLPAQTLPGLFDTATARDWLSCFDLGPHSREVPRVMGTSYALDTSRLDDEPFDERLGRKPGDPLGHEEVQLALDAAAGGWRCWYAGDAVVEHHLPRDRVSWSWMLRRAYTAGRETTLYGTRALEPIPRRLGWKDHAFRALVAPAFLTGRLRAAV